MGIISHPTTLSQVWTIKDRGTTMDYSSAVACSMCVRQSSSQSNCRDTHNSPFLPSIVSHRSHLKWAFRFRRHFQTDR